MDQPEQTKKQNGMRLRVAFIHYAICLVVLSLFIGAADTLKSDVIGSFAVLAYLGCGFYLSRAVLSRVVEWHPVYNTLENVTSAKLWFFFFGP